MALDSKLTQNVVVRADGAQLLRPFQSMNNELNRIVQKMQAISNPSTAKGRAELTKLTMEAGKAVNTLSTLQDLINNGSRAGRSRNALLGGLDEQTLGKRMMSASKLSLELDKTSKASQALEVRLAQLYRGFEQLGSAGRKVAQNDITKALNTQEALRQVQQLERQIEKLNGRNAALKTSNPDVLAMQSDINSKQATLLSRIQSGRRVDWTKEIAELSLVVDGYAKLTRAEEASGTASASAAAKRRAAIIDTINMNEAQLRASINRGSSGYSFTQAQARGFDIKALNKEIEDGTARLGRYQQVMDRALTAGKTRSVDMLATGFGNLKNRVEEATAQVRAFEALPEQKMKSMTSMLFAGGGTAFAKRIIGAGAISYAGFAALSAIQNSAHYVVELDDALAKLQAIAGATDPEMAKLSRSIFDVAENSRYSTLEITQAATQIAQAGYAAKDADKVLKSSLALATGSGSTVAEGVDTMTSALGAFQLQATESTRVTDVLMNALNESKLSMTQLQQVIQYAGATAHEAGISLEELSTFAALAANAGIKSGSTIGTGIRMLIAELQAPSQKFQGQLKALGLTMADVDVKSKGLAEVINTLTRAGFTAEAAYGSLEKRTAALFLALRGQMDTYSELSQAITQTGSAARAQETAMGSLSAQWQKFLNLLAEIGMALTGPFMNAFKGALEIMNAVMSGVIDMSKEFASGLGATSESAAHFASVMTDVLAPAIAGFFIGGPWGAAIGAIFGFVGAMGHASDALTDMEAKASEADETLKAQKQTVASVDEAINRLVDRSGTLKTNQVALQTETVTLTQRFEGLATSLHGATLNYENLLAAMLKYRQEQLQQAAATADATRIAQRDVSNAAIGQLRQNEGSLQGVFNHSYVGFKGAVGQAASYVKSTETNPEAYGQMNSDQLLQRTIGLQSMINQLHLEKNQNGIVKELIDLLQQRLELLNTVSAARAKINDAWNQSAAYQETISPAGKMRDAAVADIRGNITKGLHDNEVKGGSGQTLLDATVERANLQIQQWIKQLSALDPTSPKAFALQRSIDDMQRQVSRISTSEVGDKNQPWNQMQASEVKRRLEQEFPGIKVGSAAPRRPGDPAYTPGTLHGVGRALDIQGLPKGVSIDQVLSYLTSSEGLGLELATGHNGFWDERTRPSTAKTWTGSHYHVGWNAAKQNSWQKATDRADNKDEQTTKRLLEQGDQLVLDTIGKRIQTIMDKAKTGTDTPAGLQKQLDDQVADYQKAALKKFDDANPTKDLTADQLKLREMDRQKVLEDVAAKAQEWHANLWKQIQDTTEKALDSQLAELKRVLDEANAKADAALAKQQSRVDALSNRYNRNQFGDGVIYRENRKLEDAQLEANKSKLANETNYTTGLGGVIDQQKAYLGTLTPGSELYIEAQKKLIDYQQQYNAAMQDTVKLQADIDAQQQQLADVPLGQRLQDAANAWREQSGAMDSWKKMAENGVGPMLDNLASGLTDFFTSIMDGSKSAKQALADFLRSFVQFVLGYIAKCLALMAINAIMKAMGIPTPSAMGGGAVRDPGKIIVTADRQSNGALLNGGPIPGRAGGGPIYDYLRNGGGKVAHGVSNRDSVLYNLARDEYVVKSKSVRSLGLPFMDMINEHGAKGLAAMHGASVMQSFQMPRQETNVYVVKPDSAPSMGPNDVLVAINEDILQGGTTKKLIKQVAQGAL